MKKYIRIILVILVLLANGVACINNKSVSTNNETESDKFFELTNYEKELQDQANLILRHLKERDFEKLSLLISKERGVIFSPYSYVTERCVVFTADQVKDLKLTDEFLWGAFDGSAEPMDLSVNEYFERFVYNREFLQAPRISVDQIIQTGNTKSNLDDFFPNTHFVEYNFPPYPDDAVLWDSLRLVFEKVEDQWMLLGVVHDCWTI
ncbi:MAG: hypothetical protein FWG14_12390 [Peptococcaceae bacterium]|nr:hypothetical protein [Peptococcaceae bacterium]